jgi:hypothetical protein
LENKYLIALRAALRDKGAVEGAGKIEAFRTRYSASGARETSPGGMGDVKTDSEEEAT